MALPPLRATAYSEINEFLQWVEDTGRPQDWRLTVTSRPTKDADFEVMQRFEIPLAYRKKVEMVPCSICSPNSPKFWEGYLVNFPREQRYRVIGHRCGEQHFGTSFRMQVKRLEDIERDKGAVDFLLENLPRVPDLIRVAEALVIRNGEIDRIRAELVNVMSKGLVKRLAREGAEGSLKIAETKLVATRRADGREAMQSETIVTAMYPISEINFLRDQRAGASWAMNAVRALRGFPETDDDIQADLLRWNQTIGACGDAKDRFRHAEEELARAIDFTCRAITFFSKPNFASLRAWTTDKHCPLQFRAGIDTLGRLTASVPGQARFFLCEMRACLTDPMPTLH